MFSGEQTQPAPQQSLFGNSLETSAKESGFSIPTFKESGFSIPTFTETSAKESAFSIPTWMKAIFVLLLVGFLLILVWKREKTLHYMHEHWNNMMKYSYFGNPANQEKSEEPPVAPYEKPTHQNDKNEVFEEETNAPAAPNLTNTPGNQVAPEADDSYSKIQTSKSSGKSGWCFIGEDRGFRSCVEVGENDKCMSGDIFKSKEICENPTLRP
jgi:hypothetical protein